MAIKTFSQKLGSKPLVPIKKIYQANVKSAATYEAGVWGMAPIDSLQAIDNRFFKSMVSLPQSYSNYILHIELDLPHIDAIKG